jgi:hypothetical protein
MIRIGVFYKGYVYKIFNVNTSKDESIFVHSYRKSGKIGIVQSSNNKFTYDLNKTKTVEFECNKHSFHSSGIIHDTDKFGKRIYDYDGQKFFPFKDIIDCITLFSIYPTIFSDYPKIKIKEVKQYENFKIIDIEAYNFHPFQFTVYLSKSSYNFEREAFKLNSKYPSLFFRIKKYLPNHNLDLIFRYHQSSSEKFPKDEVFIHSIMI